METAIARLAGTFFLSLDYGGRSARILAGSGGSSHKAEKITA
jgi:hypothetical protein